MHHPVANGLDLSRPCQQGSLPLPEALKERSQTANAGGRGKGGKRLPGTALPSDLNQGLARLVGKVHLRLPKGGGLHRTLNGCKEGGFEAAGAGVEDQDGHGIPPSTKRRRKAPPLKVGM
jgi:hypothetical protein